MRRRRTASHFLCLSYKRRASTSLALKDAGRTCRHRRDTLEKRPRFFHNSSRAPPHTHHHGFTRTAPARPPSPRRAARRLDAAARGSTPRDKLA